MDILNTEFGAFIKPLPESYYQDRCEIGYIFIGF